MYEETTKEPDSWWTEEESTIFLVGQTPWTVKSFVFFFLMENL